MPDRDLAQLLVSLQLTDTSFPSGLYTMSHGLEGFQQARLIIGGDVFHYASVLDDERFPIIGDDLEAQAASAARLRELRDAGATVMPGHDPDVLGVCLKDIGGTTPACVD